MDATLAFGVAAASAPAVLADLLLEASAATSSAEPFDVGLLRAFARRAPREFRSVDAGKLIKDAFERALLQPVTWKVDHAPVAGELLRGFLRNLQLPPPDARPVAGAARIEIVELAAAPGGGNAWFDLKMHTTLTHAAAAASSHELSE